MTYSGCLFDSCSEFQVSRTWDFIWMTATVEEYCHLCDAIENVLRRDKQHVSHGSSLFEFEFQDTKRFDKATATGEIPVSDCGCANSGVGCGWWNLCVGCGCEIRVSVVDVIIHVSVCGCDRYLSTQINVHHKCACGEQSWENIIESWKETF